MDFLFVEAGSDDCPLPGCVSVFSNVWPQIVLIWSLTCNLNMWRVLNIDQMLDLYFLISTAAVVKVVLSCRPADCSDFH